MANALKFLVTAIAIAAVLTLSGCTGQQQTSSNATATPTPAPTAAVTATPSPTPAGTGLPVNTTVQKQYSYVDKFQAGIGHYNSGINYARTGQALFNSSDYMNASRQMALAAESMGLAMTDFSNMGQYAQTSPEQGLSDKWLQTANYAYMGYQNASYAYQEYANQSSSSQPNLVYYNTYVAQANSNNRLADQSKAEAEAVERTIPLFNQTPGY